MLKGIFYALIFRQILVVALTAAITYEVIEHHWEAVGLLTLLWLNILYKMGKLYHKNAQKIAFMFDAIENNDYTFKYTTKGHAPDDRMVSESINRITQIMLQAKTDAQQKEKYYELIMNSVNTGILVIDDNGYVYQTNNEALRLLGLNILTHAKQLDRVDSLLEEKIMMVQPGEKQQISFNNERGTVNLSIRVSEMTLNEKHVRIIAINDINNELDQKEIDSWIRLTRVLTHEIMNSVTPITSLSDTLLSIHGDASKEVRNGLETIRATGKSLISFVESYRKFTHIPTPHPTLFYVGKFAEQMVQLARHHMNYPNIRIETSITPDDLIVYADENLTTQVVQNLLKNAIQAIGDQQADGHILLKAYCNKDEAVIIEVSNNGPLIPQEEIDHIFVPFFTTKEGGSGIGLSVSRQIMRLSGGSLTLKSNPTTHYTTFVMTFP